MKKGFTGNLLLKCSATDDAANDDDQEKVVIRIFGHFPFHRDSEVCIMRKLSEKDVIPLVYCR